VFPCTLFILVYSRLAFAGAENSLLNVVAALRTSRDLDTIGTNFNRAVAHTIRTKGCFIESDGQGGFEKHQIAGVKEVDQDELSELVLEAGVVCVDKCGGKQDLYGLDAIVFVEHDGVEELKALEIKLKGDPGKLDAKMQTFKNHAADWIRARTREDARAGVEVKVDWENWTYSCGDVTGNIKYSLYCFAGYTTEGMTAWLNRNKHVHAVDRTAPLLTEDLSEALLANRKSHRYLFDSAEVKDWIRLVLPEFKGMALGCVWP
jgi:hypothetical protein